MADIARFKYSLSSLDRRAVAESAERVKKLAEAGIRHRIRQLVCDGIQGAFLAAVEGPGREIPFFGWFELRDGLVGRYVLRPVE